MSVFQAFCDCKASMMNKLACLFFFVCISQLSLSGQGFGNSSPLKEWHFIQEDIKLGGRVSLDHSTWQKVTVPHDWSVTHFASPNLYSCTGYLPGGIGWYRTTFSLDSSEKDKRRYLYFEGVYNNSEVYINGKWLGKRPNGYVSFMYDISPYIQYDKENVIAVRVDHSQQADSRWYTGSGIYRDVHLVTASQLHIDQWGLSWTAGFPSEDKAEVSINTCLKNHRGDTRVSVVQELFDAENKLVGKSSSRLEVGANSTAELSQTIALKNPHRWDIENPYLYHLRTTILEHGHVVDSTWTRVGIRKIEFDPDKGFALNGRWMKIKGVCLHHDAGVLGAAVPVVVWRERLLKLKSIGVNGIRMSHNPQATALYDLCDELGLLVMDEAFDEWEYPKKKWLTGWNVGEPGFQGAADYFREWSKRDLHDIIMRDRNHPSIIMWSIGNEVDYPNDPYSHPVLSDAEIGQKHKKGYLPDHPHADRLGDIAKELAAEVRAVDRSRPVTAALAGPVMSNYTEYPAALDVVGYNYTESRYDQDHSLYPKRVLYGSETRSDLNAWLSVKNKDFIFGQFIWTGFDYLGEAGRWPSRGFTTGLIDLSNRIKGRGHFREALWLDRPTAWLGSYSIANTLRKPTYDEEKNWNYEEGEMIRVVCFTNCEAAELQLNGKAVAERKTVEQDQVIVYWDIPFQKGKLEVLCFNKNEHVASDSMITNTPPVKIVAHTQQSHLSGKYEVAIVTINLLDINGNIVLQGDNEISCHLKGNGKLLGLENASSNAAENFNDNRHRCRHGRLVAYIQATEDKGSIELTFSSPFLEKVRVEIEIR